MTARAAPGRLAWLAGFLAVLALVWTYYWFEWRSFQAFNLAIDFSPQFMQDFVGHYYPMGQQILHDATPVGKYFYSSFFALLLVPFGRLPLESAIAAWTVVEVACTAGLLAVSALGFLRLSRARSLWFVALFLTSYPILHNFKWGQVSVLLTLCIVAAVAAADRGRSVLAGALLAFGASIKFYPALFLVYFVMRRDVRACVSFLVTLAACYVLLPASVLGFEPWFRFERSIAELLSRPGLAARDTNSQYVGHVGARWLASSMTAEWLSRVQQALVLVGYAIGAAALGATTLLVRRGSACRAGLAVVPLFLALPFLIKTSWPHYFAYMPLCQTALMAYHLEQHLQSFWRRCNLALCVLSMALTSLPVFNRFPGWEAYNAAGMLFVANVLLLVPALTAVDWRRTSEMPGNGPVNERLI